MKIYGAGRGFSLVEILMVILIAAVLAAVGIAGFGKSKSKTRKNEAITYVRMISTAERMYWAKNQTYLPLANKSDIKTQLGLEIEAPGFTFDVEAVAARTFKVTARETALPNRTIILDQDGNWSGTYAPLPLPGD